MSIAIPSPKNPTLFRPIFACALLAFAGPAIAQAATATRVNNTDSLDLGTAWSTNATLTNADTALWNSTIDGTVVGANTTTVGAGVTVGAIQVTNPAVSILIGAGAGPLTLGNLTVANAIDMSAATADLGIASSVALANSQTWNVGAARTLGVSGIISGSTFGITKAGDGVLTLSAANTFDGPVNIAGGTLTLDFSAVGAPTDNILAPATLLALNGGTLSLVGATGATNTQTVAGTTINSGRSVISVTQNGATAVNLNLGAIARNAGGVLDFVLPTTGSISATGNLTNGVLTSAASPDGVAFATLGGITWATIDSGSIIGLSTYQTATDPATWTATDNVSLAANPDASLGNTTINTLRLTGDSAITVGATETLTLGTGGLLVNGTGINTISGGTLLGSGGVNKELVIIQANETNALVISSVIGNNGGPTGLTKAGNGALTLNAVNTFNGGLNISAGTVTLGVANAVPVANAVNVAGGATLDAGTFSQTFSALTGTGNVIMSTGSTLTINNGNASTLAANVSGVSNFTKTGAAVLTLSSTLNSEGAVNVSTGTLNVITGGGFTNAGAFELANAATNMTVSGNVNAATMNIFSQGSNGTVGGLVMQNGGNVVVSGLVQMNTPSGNNGQKVYLVTEAGSNFTAGNLTFIRSGGSANSTAGGIRINGGNLTVLGTLLSGRDSHAAILLSGGNLTAGTFITSSTNNGRGTNVTITGGSLSVTSAANGGLVINNGIGAGGGGATVNISGGTHFLEMLSQAGVGVTNGSSNFTLSGTGQVYIGSGGVVNSGTGTILTSANFTLNGGTLGAKSDWTGTIPMTINGVTFKAADVNDNPFNITLAGALNGAGALIKTGNGQLTLGATNNYSGGTNITAGTVQVGNGGNTGTLGSNTTVTNNGVLAINRNNTLTFTSIVSGTGSLRQIGTGTTNITSVSSYTGTTEVTNGVLALSNAGSINSTSGIVINGANATFRHGSSVALTAPVSFGGAGTFQNNAVYNGDLTVPVSAALSGTGNVTGLVSTQLGGIIAPGTSVGTLTVGSLTAANGTIFNYEFSGSGTNDLLVVTTGSGLNLGTAGFNLFQEGTDAPWLGTGTYNLIQFSGTPVIDLGNLSVLNPDVTLSYSFQISGNSSFLQLVIGSSSLPNTWVATGGGSWGSASNWSTGVPAANVTVTFPGSIQDPSTVTLDGDRTAAGMTVASPQPYTFAQGTSGNLTLDNGASAAELQVTLGSHTLSTPLAFTANGLSVNITTNSQLALSGNILPTAGSLTKIGNGDLVLSGTNAYSGGTVFNAGNITFSAVENFGSGTLLFNGGALKWATGTSADISTQSLTFAEGGAIFNTNGNDVTLANAFGNDGPGALTKVGAGILTLNGTNTYMGGTIIQEGAVQFSTLANIGPGNLTFNGGTLRWATGTSTDISTIPTLIDSGGATFDTNGNDVVLTSAIGGGGAGNFTKAGNGVLTIGTLSTYAGATFVNAGTLTAGANGALVTASDYTVAAGANLQIGATAQTLSGNISGSGLVTVGNGGNLSLNNISGARTVSASLTGNGTLTKAGPGTVMLTGDNNAFTGAIQLLAGTLALGPGAQMLNAGAITPSTAANNTLLINGGDFATNVTANFTMTGNTGTAFQIDSGNATFAALRGVTTSGGVRIQINGGNTTAASIEIQRSSNDNPGPNFNTGLFVNGGNLTVTGNVNLGSGASGAALIQGGNMTVNGAFLVSNNPTSRTTGLQVTSGNLNITNTTNGLVLVGSGPSNAVVTLSGGVSQIERISFGLNSTIGTGNTGTLNLSGTGALYVGSGGIVVNGVGMTTAFNISGGTLGALANWTGDAPITLTGNTSVIRAADIGGTAFDITLSGDIGGDGALTKTGNGQLTLAGNNTYTGGTIISAGTLQIGNGVTNGGLGTGNVVNDGQLVFSPGGTGLTVPGVISGSGALIHEGPGSTTLTAENTYTGVTFINGGTLNLSNATGSALAGNVLVNAGGALGGNGTLAGNVTVNTFGAVAPGTDAVGTLTVGAINLAVGTGMKFEFTTTPTPANDQLIVTGLDGFNSAGTEIFLYKEGTTSAFITAGTYNLITFNGNLGGGLSNLTIGNSFYGFDYALAVNGSVVQATITVQDLPFSWTSTTDGFWSAASNWSDNIVPNAAGQLVNFLAINENPVAVVLDGSRTVGGIVFASDVSYAINPNTGSLTLDNSGTAANISVFAGSHSITAPIVLTANGAIANISTGSQLDLVANIGETAAGSITKTGNGALVLSGFNTFTGGVNLNAGTLFLHSFDALGAGPLTITGGTLANNLGIGLVLSTNNAQNWNGNFTFAGPNDLDLGTGAVTLSDNRTVTVTAGTLTVGGVVSGAFSLFKEGTGVLALNGVNTYTGGTVVFGGTLSLGTDNALASTSPVILQNGGSLDIGFTSQSFSTLHLVNGNVLGAGTVTTANNYDIQSGEVAANLAGDVGLVKTTAANATLTGSNVYTGVTDIQNGNLIVVGSNPLPTDTGVTLSSVGNTATLTLGNATTPGSVTLSSLVSGGGTANVRGGTASFASQLTLNISSGTSILDFVLGDGTGNTSAGNQLQLIKTGNGILDLAAVNTYIGGTMINAGTVRITAASGLGTAAGAATINNGTLDIDSVAEFTTNRAFSFGDLNSTINIANATITFGTGTLSGFGNLNKTGPGILQLNSPNSTGFTGDTNILAGTIVLGNSLALQASTYNRDNQGGELSFGTLTAASLGGLKGAQDFALPDNFALTVGANGLDTTYTGVISGNNASFNKTGIGAITLTGNNTYTGNTLGSGGLIVFAALENLGQGTGIVFNGGGLRWATGSVADISTRTVSLVGNGFLDTNGNNVTLANPIGNFGSGGLTKGGEGSLTLNGVNDYFGNTTVSQGTLILASGASISAFSNLDVGFGAKFDGSLSMGLTVGSLNGSGEVVVGSGAPLAVGGSGASTNFLGTLTDTGGAGSSLVKEGAGAMDFGGTYNFSGAVNINGGTLNFNTSLPASIPVNVNFGGTLGGTGSVGNATVAAGGRIAPGASIGTLTVGNLTWNSDDVLSAQWELSNFDNTADLLSVTGTLTKGDGSVFLFDFQGTGYFNGADPNTYTLVDFGTNSGFTVGDFAYQNLGAGLYGSFLLNANNLQFIVVPEPSTWALLAGCAALGLAALRRRRNAR